jgi:hypothetical protein
VERKARWFRINPLRHRAAAPLRSRGRGLGFRGLVAVLVVAGCAGRRDPVEIPDPVADARIGQELRARIAAEPSLSAARVRVEVEAARVQLSGSVEGIGAWNCALRNAWLISGVRGVNDFLIIERGPPEVTCRAVRGEVLTDRTQAPER